MDAALADRIVAGLSWEPPTLVRAVINLDEEPLWPFAQHPIPPGAPPAPLGALGRLPPELLDEVLARLDLQALSRLSRVSVRANIVVDQVPAYRDLLAHAAQAVRALAGTRLLHVHSVTRLHAALRGEDGGGRGGGGLCEVCRHEFGPFLFLLDCTRCCAECMLVSPALRAVPVWFAEAAFGIDLKKADSSGSRNPTAALPVMVNLSGSYGEHGRPAIAISELVSALAVNELVLKEHGGGGGGGDYGRHLEDVLGTLRGQVRSTAAYLHTARRTAEGQDPVALQMAQGFRLPHHAHFGMAMVPFPLVRRGSAAGTSTVEAGVWCRGCNYIIGDDIRMEKTVARMRRARRAWLREEFLEHVKHCDLTAAFLKGRVPGQFRAYLMPGWSVVSPSEPVRAWLDSSRGEIQLADMSLNEIG